MFVAGMRQVSAAPVIYEGFQYNTGPLLGQTNPSTGNNWLRAGASAGPTAINVVSNSLNGPAGYPASAGNSIAMTGVGDNSGSTERLALPSTINSGTVYYSFLLRTDSLSGSNNTIGGFFITMNNTGNSSQTTNPSVAPARVQGRIDPTDGTRYDLGIFNVAATAGASSWSSGLTVDSTVHLIVCGYTFNTGSTTDDVASMWIDPDPSTFGAATPPAPTVTATGGDVASPGISSILLRQSPAPMMTLDELRLDTSWAGVTTVPEPATASLILAGTVGLLARRRSRA
jgi:hypothetical protein